MKWFCFLPAGLWLLPSGPFSGIVYKLLVYSVRHKVPASIYELNPTPKIRSASLLPALPWPTPGNREAEKCQLLNYLFIPQVFVEHLLHASHCARCWEQNCEQHRSYGCCGRRYRKDGNFFPFQIYLYTLIFIRTPFRASHHSPHFINHPWVEPQRIQDLLTRKNLSRSSNIN